MKLFILLAVFGVSVLESSITGPPQIVRFTRHRGPFHSFGTRPTPVDASLVNVHHSESSYRPITKQPTFDKHAKPFTINPWGPLSPYIHHTKAPLNLHVTGKPPRSGITPKEEIFHNGGVTPKITVSHFELSDVVTRKDKAPSITKSPHIVPDQVGMTHASGKPYPRPTYQPRETKTLLTNCPCCHC